MYDSKKVTFSCICRKTEKELPSLLQDIYADIRYEMAALFQLNYLNEGYNAQMVWSFTVSLGARGIKERRTLLTI